MKAFTSFFARFDRLDTAINSWLVANSSSLLRVGTGIVFLEFGLVKFFSGVSPVDELANHTISLLSGGLLSDYTATYFVAILECITGLCFLSRRLLQPGVWLLVAQLVSAILPLVLFSNEVFLSLFYAPSLVVQYILSEIVLVMAGLFIAANWTEAHRTSNSRKVWI